MAELRCILDFETRSRANLKDVGAINYAKCESSSIFCLGYRINDGPVYLWIPERAPVPQDLLRCFKSGVLVAHNASFERAITTYLLPRYGTITRKQKAILRAIPATQWRCTAAKAAMYSLPRALEAACKALSLQTQKDMRGNALIKKYSKPRKPTQKNPKEWWDDKSDLRHIYRYCMTDVQAEYELDQAVPDLTPQEQAIWELDQKINDRGVLIDTKTVKSILGMVSQEMDNIQNHVRVLSHGEIEGSGQVSKILAWVNDRGAELADLKAQTVRDALLRDDLFIPVRQMLEYRQNGSRTSTAKYQSMLKAVGSDDRARELLLYCGGIPTARWSGKRIQPQNFPRGHLPKDDCLNIIEAINA